MSYEPTVWQDGDHVTSAKLNKLEQGVNSMSYTPTVWNAGDVVTAEKLNKLEQGVAEGGGGGATFPTFTNDGEAWSCDKTYDECLEMCESLTSLDQPSYPCLQVASGTTAFNIMLVVEDVGICVYLFETALTYHSDGTITEE